MEENTEVIDVEDIEGYEPATEDLTEGVDYSENFNEINANLQKLNGGIEQLIQIYELESNTETTEDDVFLDPEEVPPDPVVIALENLDGNVSELRRELAEYNAEEATTEEATTEEVTTEEVTEEPTEEPQLVYLGSGTDTHLYLSSEVENADLNDVYSMLLSTRNVLLLFFLVFLILKVGSMLRDIFARLMNK